MNATKKTYPLLLQLFFSFLLSGCGDKIIVEGNNPGSNCIIKPALNVYLENSGSMDGYMCNGSQLKDAPLDYIGDLSEHTSVTRLNYINSRIIPCKDGLEQYIRNMNVGSFQKAGGNRVNSDIGDMLKMILQNMTDSTVSIFVSDCILDLPEANTQDFLTRCRISIKQTINNYKTKIQNPSVEIIKMTSNFNGTYFYPNRGSGSVHLQNVQRPYYIWIFGNNDLLTMLNASVPLSGLEKYGFDNAATYTQTVDLPYRITNKWGTGNTIRPTQNGLEATLNVDLRATLQTETFLLNPDNYSFNTPHLRLKNINPSKDIQYPHSINIVISPNIASGMYRLDLKASQLPVWISETNDDSGKDIKNNLDKTTGLTSLVGGIADAYQNNSVITTFTFTIRH